jgi:penicillin amidase
MFEVQLDDSALFHERWRQLVLDLLTPEAAGARPGRAEFRRLVASTWTGRASTESAAYRLVRTFRQAVQRELTVTINEIVQEADPDFDFGRANRAEGPFWPLVDEQPPHLLSGRYGSWNDLLLAAVDQSIDELTGGSGELALATWGVYNRTMIIHPLSGSLALAGRWLNMPDAALPGDVYTPRAHSPRAGPSERLVVSPGREAEGLAHMPAGQSGHPLSPHYRDQHRAWVEGTPLPFLPGPTIHTLVLTPRR